MPEQTPIYYQIEFHRGPFDHIKAFVLFPNRDMRELFDEYDRVPEAQVVEQITLCYPGAKRLYSASMEEELEKRRYHKHDFDTIEERWDKGYEYAYIPTGQSYRELLLERCGKELLDAFSAHMWVKDAPLHSGHVRVTLQAYGRSFYLQNAGSTERPTWQLSGHTLYGKWLCIELEDNGLRSHLEGLLDLLKSKAEPMQSEHVL